MISHSIDADLELIQLFEKNFCGFYIYMRKSGENSRKP